MNAISYQDFVRGYAKQLRANDAPPASRRVWDARAVALRKRVFEAIGALPTQPCPLDAQILGELKRPGYVIERVTFQTRPDVWCTANLFRPDPAPNKGPAVLVVHGHWRMARLEPVVQSRCIGLAKLGFTVFSVDAFGSGERYTYPGPGTYHGALWGGTLWPTGLMQMSIQIADNRRAVDYMLTRPEIDPERIGVTGESGGGNQTMYAGAFDDRLKAVVPVCSVGNYQSYLLVLCCICEVIPGALTFTEEGDILGLIAPRALLVINAGRDSVQFSPAEAKISLARAKSIYELFGAGDKLRHDVFDAGHGYDKPMRESMYGWMTRWLKNEGRGEPIPEPAFATENPDDLKCYPDPDTRPKTWLFGATLAKRIGSAMLAKQFSVVPQHPEEWESTAVFMRGELQKALGTMPAPARAVATTEPGVASVQMQTSTVTLTPEPNVPLVVTVSRVVGTKSPPPACVMLHMDGGGAALATPLAKSLRESGWQLFAPDLRSTPRLGANIRPVDHNEAEYGLWIGRPLMGQWVFEVQTLLDWLVLQPIDRRKIFVAGFHSAGLIALVLAALDPDCSAGAILVDTPVSYLTDVAYGDVWRMGAILPGILRAGDVPHLAAAVAPRRLAIVDGVDPQGAKLTERNLKAGYDFTSQIYKTHRAPDNLTITTEPVWSDLVKKLG